MLYHILHKTVLFGDWHMVLLVLSLLKEKTLFFRCAFSSAANIIVLHAFFMSHSWWYTHYGFRNKLRDFIDCWGTFHTNFISILLMTKCKNTFLHLLKFRVPISMSKFPTVCSIVAVQTLSHNATMIMWPWLNWSTPTDHIQECLRHLTRFDL